MTLYAVPRRSNNKVFRTFAYGSVGLMLIFVALGWNPVGLLVAIMLGVFLLLFKDSIDKSWRKASFDVSDDRIIGLFEGRPPREFLLREITFIGESRTGLLVQINEGPKGFFIPRAVDHYDQLRQELSEHCQVTPIQNPATFVPILPVILVIGLYAFLFTARVGVLVLIAGVVALLFQAWWIVSIREIWAKTRSPKLVMSVSIFSWVVLLWLVYQRVSSYAL
jgi:hypothetical protein